MKILFYGFRHNHIRALYKKAAADPCFEIVGCVEPNEAAREAAAAALGAVFSDRTYAEWLSTDIDAVAIGCPYGERGAAVIAALRAGKHVISDKHLPCGAWDHPRHRGAKWPQDRMHAGSAGYAPDRLRQADP